MPLTVKQRMIQQLIAMMEGKTATVGQKIAIAKLLDKVNPKIGKPSRKKSKDLDNI